MSQLGTDYQHGEAGPRQLEEEYARVEQFFAQRLITHRCAKKAMRRRAARERRRTLAKRSGSFPRPQGRGLWHWDWRAVAGTACYWADSAARSSGEDTQGGANVTPLWVSTRRNTIPLRQFRQDKARRWNEESRFVVRRRSSITSGEIWKTCRASWIT